MRDFDKKAKRQKTNPGQLTSQRVQHTKVSNNRGQVTYKATVVSSSSSQASTSNVSTSAPAPLPLLPLLPSRSDDTAVNGPLPSALISKHNEEETKAKQRQKSGKVIKLSKLIPASTFLTASCRPKTIIWRLILLVIGRSSLSFP